MLKELPMVTELGSDRGKGGKNLKIGLLQTSLVVVFKVCT